MRSRRKFNKQLTTQHQDFINKYLYTRNNRRGLYKLVYFCEDEDIAIVLRTDDYYGNSEAWGCVNMANQLLVPFEYRRIWDYGRFLIAKNSGGMLVFNKKGDILYMIRGVCKTGHKAYMKLLDAEQDGFRLSIRKMEITKSLYQEIHILENGLVFLRNFENKVGLLLFSKQKLPCEYEAIAIPQNGYTLAIKASSEQSEGSTLYDCLLMKVRSQIKSEGSIHPTGITLFTKKSWDEIIEYFNDTEQFEKECNSIICYNETVKIDSSSLEFFPFDRGLPNLRGAVEEEEDNEEEENTKGEDYNPWSRENYSYEEALYDALGGEMDAIWNID